MTTATQKTAKTTGLNNALKVTGHILLAITTVTACVMLANVASIAIAAGYLTFVAGLSVRA